MFTYREANTAVLICILLLLSGQTGARALDLKRDAVAIWDFDEGAGTVLKDSSGHDHHGNIVEAAWIQGDFGSALRFSGKGHYVRVPDAPGLRIQAPYTLGVWFRTTSSENNGVFLLLTDEPSDDALIPGQPFSFGRLHQAQALGDLQSLLSSGRRVAHVDLTPDRSEAIEALARALGD